MLKNNKLIYPPNYYPSVFIIGTQKSGTSTLFEWLKQDNRLQFPKYKETHYFSTNYKLGSKWYLQLFKNYKKNKIRCEIDPSYLFHPKAISRILKITTFPKFIVILRRPIDRAYSHYLMSQYRGYETLSFVEALDQEKNRIIKDDFSLNNFSYLTRSEYSYQLENLISQEANCLFINFDDIFLNNNQLKNINELYKFIGLNFRNNINLNIISNRAKTYKNRGLRNLLYKDNYLKTFIKKIITSPLLQYKIKFFLDKMNYKTINGNHDKYNDLIKNLPKKYISWNNQEMLKTEKITKLNLSNWKI